MDHSCPHCGKNLGWKLIRSRPLRGAVLDEKALGATLFCPFCGGALRFNKDKYESSFFSLFVLSAAVSVLLSDNFKSITIASVGLATISIMGAGYVWYCRKYLTTRRRYVPYQL